MPTFSSASQIELFSLMGRVQKACTKGESVERAAQAVTDLVWDKYADALALVRIYATIPYGSLPSSIRKFVDGIVQAKSVSIEEQTPVLSLLGTRGKKEAWNDARQSAGHQGIPLVSSAFVESIPMLARLLVDLGVGLSWLDRSDFGLQLTRADWSGLFYVPDARTATDEKKRHIIPAQDFVQEQGVRTVFGMGGSFPSGSLFAAIFFTREDVPKSAAEMWLPFATAFKTGATPLVRDGRHFGA